MGMHGLATRLRPRGAESNLKVKIKFKNKKGSRVATNKKKAKVPAWEKHRHGLAVGAIWLSFILFDSPRAYIVGWAGSKSRGFRI